jgi:hypothetical protein
MEVDNEKFNIKVLKTELQNLFKPVVKPKAIKLNLNRQRC